MATRRSNADGDERQDRLVRLTTNPVSVWLIRNLVSHVDPWLFRASGGRLTCFGPPAMPMITLTMRGRRSGKRRSVHLACLERDGAHLVVASAMGQAPHPGWYHNLRANPDVEAQIPGERFAARAELLTPEEKRAVWDEVHRAIPQMRIYERRTEREIAMFRIRRREPGREDG